MALKTSLHTVALVMRVPTREMCILTVRTTQVVSKKIEKERASIYFKKQRMCRRLLLQVRMVMLCII